MKNILIVEDDAALREGLGAALSGDGIRTGTAGCLADARRLLSAEVFDLLLLDCNLPDGDGIDFCREVSRTVPVVFLTVRDGELDEVAAFRVGACDYVKKPFSLTILTERIHAALRRHAGQAYEDPSYQDGRFRFDFAAMTFQADGKKLFLSAAEQKLLAILCRHRGQLLERRRLMEWIWDCDEYIDENALSVTVKRLRDKLGADCIGTVYGMGYIWKGGGQ